VGKVLVIGLDGADWGILRPLMDRDELPHLYELCQRGLSAPLQSTFPPITTSGWVALATGMDPGGTGILQFRSFDFRRFDGYHPHIVDAGDVRGRTWLERLAPDSLSCVGLPLTWPPFPVPGVLVAGHPRPHLDEMPVLPLSWAARLPRWPASEPGNRRRADLAGAETCQMWDRLHVDITRSLLRQRDDDLTICVLSGTDHIAHRFWGGYRSGHPMGAALRAQYRLADQLVGSLVADVGPDCDVLVISDHGFGDAPCWSFSLSRWLRDKGWLALREGSGSGGVPRLLRGARGAVPKGLWRELRQKVPDRWLGTVFNRSRDAHRLDPKATRAFSIEIYPGYEGVCINVQGRQHEGSVLPSQQGELVDRLIDELHGIELRVPGTSTGPVGRLRAWRREELFSGSELDKLPDILVEFPEGWRGDAALDGEGPLCGPVAPETLNRDPGGHQRDGVLIAAGPRIACPAEGMDVAPAGPPRLVDIAPTLCRLLGYEIPQQFVGRVLDELFEPSALAALPPPRPLRAPGESVADAAPADATVGRRQRDEIERSLRDLGYL